MLGPFPHSNDAWSRLLVRAEREVGFLSLDGDSVLLASPDTGLSARFVRDARGLWIDMPLPACRSAVVALAEMVEMWPTSIHPSLPDGGPWSVAGFVALTLPLARAALNQCPMDIADDGVVEAVWAWNGQRYERAALYGELFVATAWLVRVGDGLTTAAVWSPSVATLVPLVEWVLLVGGDNTDVPVRALRMGLLLPLAEELEGGRVLSASDARWEVALATAVDARGISRVPLLSVVERSFAGTTGQR